MSVVEGGCDLRQRGRVDRTRRNRYHELMGLTRIARIDGALEPPPRGRNAGAIEHGRSAVLQCDEGSLHGFGIGAGGCGVQRSHVIAFQVGPDEPERGKGSRDRRADDFGDAEFACKRGSMQRPRPAEGGEREIARIVAALNRHDFQHFRHGVIDDVDDGSRSRPYVDRKRLSEPFAHGSRGRVVVDRQIAVQQRCLVEVAEQEVAIRHCRFAAAAAVAHGPGIGASALRADAQTSGAVNPCNRSAPGGHLGQIDHRHADRMTGSVHPAAHA